MSASVARKIPVTSTTLTRAQEETINCVSTLFEISFDNAKTYDDFVMCCDVVVQKFDDGEYDTLRKIQNVLLNVFDEHGNTLFMRATKYGNRNGLCFFKDDSAAIRATNQESSTAMHIAAQYDQIGLLKANGFAIFLNPTAANKNELKPIHFAIDADSPSSFYHLKKHYEGEYEVLCEYAAKNGKVKCFDELYKLCNKTNQITKRILHIVVDCSQNTLLQHLLKNYPQTINPIVNDFNDSGLSPIHITTKNNNIFGLTQLCKFGVNINRQSQDGNTALHYAVNNLNRKTVEVLTYFGANHSIVNEDGAAPRGLLIGKNDPDSMEMRTVLKNIRFAINEIKHPNFAIFKPQNIVFRGGGFKGGAFAGVFKYIDESNLHTSVRRYSGSSAGAYAAMLGALNVSPKAIYKQIVDLDYTQFFDVIEGSLEERISSFMDNKTGLYAKIVKTVFQTVEFCSDILANPVSTVAKFGYKSMTRILDRLYHRTGLCHGKKYFEHIENLFRSKTEIEYCTAKEFRNLVNKYPEKYKHLYVNCTMTGSPPKVIEFNTEDPEYDDVVMSSVVCNSGRFPCVFMPGAVLEKVNGKVIESPRFGHCLDGGILRNYSIDQFDKVKFVLPGSAEEIKDRQIFNDKTLGISLYSSTELTTQQVKKPDSILSLIWELGKILLSAEDILLALNPYNEHRTVSIDVKNVSTFDMNLTHERKKNLANAGYIEMRNFFTSFNQELLTELGIKSPREILLEHNLLELPMPCHGYKEHLEMKSKLHASISSCDSSSVITFEIRGNQKCGKTEFILDFANTYLQDFGAVLYLDMRIDELSGTSIALYRLQQFACSLGHDKPSNDFSSLLKTVLSDLGKRSLEKPLLLIKDHNDDNTCRVELIPLSSKKSKQIKELDIISMPTQSYEDPIGSDLELKRWAAHQPMLLVSIASLDDITFIPEETLLCLVGDAFENPKPNKYDVYSNIQKDILHNNTPNQIYIENLNPFVAMKNDLKDCKEVVRRLTEINILQYDSATQSYSMRPDVQVYQLSLPNLKIAESNTSVSKNLSDDEKSSKLKKLNPNEFNQQAFKNIVTSTTNTVHAGRKERSRAIGGKAFVSFCMRNIDKWSQLKTDCKGEICLRAATFYGNRQGFEQIAKKAYNEAVKCGVIDSRLSLAELVGLTALVIMLGPFVLLLETFKQLGSKIFS